MNLTIDIGNTRTKIVAFEGGEPIAAVALSHPDKDGAQQADYLENAIAALAQRIGTTWNGLAWCSTGKIADGLAERLQRHAPHVLRLTGLTPTPLRVDYATPHTLGADRLAAALGAVALQPGGDLLVVDVGTCVTCDFIEGGQRFVGGNISPGIQMRLRALHDYTEALPLIEADGRWPLLGSDTETAIRAGVLLGLQAEIATLAQRLTKTHPDLQVWLAGGESLRLHEALPCPLHTDPHLVARGLNSLLAI